MVVRDAKIKESFKKSFTKAQITSLAKALTPVNFGQFVGGKSIDSTSPATVASTKASM